MTEVELTYDVQVPDIEFNNCTHYKHPWKDGGGSERGIPSQLIDVPSQGGGRGPACPNVCADILRHGIRSDGVG